MPFHKFVQIGCVAIVQDGPATDKIAAIVDVIDQNRVLIEGDGVSMANTYCVKPFWQVNKPC